MTNQSKELAEIAAQKKVICKFLFAKATEELTAARQSGASPARIGELEKKCGVLRLQSEGLTTRITEGAVQEAMAKTIGLKN